MTILIPPCVSGEDLAKSRLDVRSIAIDPHNSSVLYAATKGGIIKSVDRGAKWTAISRRSFGWNPLAVAIDPLQPATIYALASGVGVFKSTDGGNHWNPANAGFPDTRAQAHRTLAKDERYVSLDALNVRALVIDPAHPTTLYMGGGEAGVFRSIDGGESWAPANSGLENRIIKALVIDPSHSTTLYAGGGVAGVFKSVDGGMTWTESNSGIINTDSLARGLVTTQIESLAIDPVNSATLYAGTNGAGAFKSIDAGVTWTQARSGFVAPELAVVRALVIDPTNSATLYAGVTSSVAGIYRSINRGEAWTIANSGIRPIDVSALAIDPSNPATIYAGTIGRGVFKTTDGGQSWRPSTLR